MKNSIYPHEWPDIDKAAYDRSARLFSWVRNMLGVKIKLHAQDQPARGDIFLFNHFSRFETFIPQFLIYEQTGAYSCAIASGEFFLEDSALSRYLRSVGVYPHDHLRLFPMLAAQILRGRKVIVFPEGGMVKDRRVMDHQGQYSIYSRITGERRKQHTGAAVLAQGLEAFKTTIRNAYNRKDRRQLLAWKEALHLDNLEQMLMAALKPTLIVPANITFYPIRSSENLLQQAVELFSDHLTPRQMEEILIEGNILLKDTDMDVRMGRPIDPCMVWHWWNRYLLDLFSANLTSLDEVFALHSRPETLRQRVLGWYFKRCAKATRNHYMVGIYRHVTINLSHLASTLIMDCIAAGRRRIEKERFYTALYIAVRRLQTTDGVNLHRSLVDAVEYMDLVDGKSRRFEQFICFAKQAGLLAEEDGHYRFLDKLCQDFDMDTIRLENPIAVYHNEAAPIAWMRETLASALEEFDDLDRRQLAAWRMEDELQALAWEKRHYSAPRYNDINALETADADPSPFLLEPEVPNGVGVLLIHGMLASPAEVRGYGKHLQDLGYTVLGVRLPGHGTSPYALAGQGWENWYASVRRGFNTLKLFCSRIVPVGFSTGGALALMLAAEGCPQTLAVVTLAVPLKMVDPAFQLVPLLHEANRLVGWISANGGIKPFIENTPEHPHTNYQHTPVKSLHDLRRLVEALEQRLPSVDVPCLVLYADRDPVVSAKSAETLMGKLGTADKRLAIIPAEHHGILMDDTAGTWRLIDEFLREARTFRHRGGGRCFNPAPSCEQLQCG